MTKTADRPAPPLPGNLRPVLYPAGVAQPTPLWAVLAFTFLNSLGSGVVTTGVAFLAKAAYGFDRTDRYWLALVMGVTYIFGALGAAPMIRVVRRAFPSLTPRAILAALMVIAGLLCALPWLARVLSSSTDPNAGQWAGWVLVGVYGPLTGVLWPLAESFLSGGRSGAVLRQATGRFNIAWSSALVVAFIAMAPLLESSPLVVILILGGVHLSCIALLAYFPPSPPGHIHQAHEPHPPVYRSLLAVMRLLLPTSYVLYSALNSYLPDAFDALHVKSSMHLILASLWLFTRVVTMVSFERLSGWHGRWWVPIVGGLLLITGFACIVLSPQMLTAGPEAAAGSAGAPGSTTVPLLVAIVGLAVFGVGMGVIYCAAIYYAMEVGSAEVDAGGKHEALIGVGYTLGPSVALLATAGVTAGMLTEERFPLTVVVGTGLIAAPVIMLAIVRSFKQSDGGQAGDRHAGGGLAGSDR